jgi:hypothetical protein
MRSGHRFCTAAALGLIVLATGATSHAECSITGTITAEMVDHELGLYRYTLELSWDTGTVYGLSHFNLWLNNGITGCVCDDFIEALAWEYPAGSSSGVPDDCMIDYEAMLECNGDPSIPDLDGILLKFEPMEDGSCEPGPMGTGTFVFYSDLEPAPISDDSLFLVDKHAGFSCTGEVTGEFPALLCDPVSTTDADWSAVKQIFRR